MHTFENVWLHGLGFWLIDLLLFSDLIHLSNLYPIVCDSLFHGSRLSKKFFKRHWWRLALSKNKIDYVQSHDCHELLYKPFTQWKHAPSTSLLPLPLEGFYPVEPYLAWRITSLFLYSENCELELIFYANPQIFNLVEFDLPFDRLSFVSVFGNVLYNDLNNDEQHVTKRDILALVFEVLMTPWYRMTLYDVNYEENDILQVESPHSRHLLKNYPDECLCIQNS